MEQVRKPNPYVIPGLVRRPIPMDRVKLILEKHGKLWFLHTLLDIVCRQQNVTKLSVFSRSRKPDVVFARHLLRFYGYELFKNYISLSEIAMFIANGRSKDHSLVSKSRNMVMDTIDQNSEWGANLRTAIQAIDFKLNQISIDESDSTNRKGR